MIANINTLIIGALSTSARTQLYVELVVGSCGTSAWLNLSDERPADLSRGRGKATDWMSASFSWCVVWLVVCAV